MVSEGQVSQAGKQVAEMGRSCAARDRLHIDIRDNGKPVDPRAYLPERCRSGPCALARTKGGPFAQAPSTNPATTFRPSPASTLNVRAAAAFVMVSRPMP